LIVVRFLIIQLSASCKPTAQHYSSRAYTYSNRYSHSLV